MRYLKTLAITVLVALLSYFGLTLSLTPSPIAAEYWVRELITVKRHIVDQYRGQRKIIVASGSSTLFNIDTNRLTRDIGIPAINLGLHAGLSLGTILGEADRAAEKGDIVILPLEPPYYCTEEPTSWQARSMIAWQPERWSAMPLTGRIRALLAIGPAILPELIASKLQQTFHPESLSERIASLDDAKTLAKFNTRGAPSAFSYSILDLDSLGNIRNAHQAAFRGVPTPADRRIDVCVESLRRLSSFSEAMHRRGVVFYFANVPYVRTGNIDRDRVNMASAAFARDLSSLAPVLDERAQLIMDRTLFFNTDLHLNSAGRVLRTALLLDSLRQKQSF